MRRVTLNYTYSPFKDTVLEGAMTNSWKTNSWKTNSWKKNSWKTNSGKTNSWKTNSWRDKLLKIQTPERQTPEIMKFFSEWNMIKFINFRTKNPQISLKKFSIISNLNMHQAAKYYNDQNNHQIYYYLFFII